MPLKLATVRWYAGKPHRKLCLPAKARKASEMRCNPTDSEALLWDELRDKRCRGVRFRRQAVLFGYIVDFFAPSVGLAVEVDGSSHYGRESADVSRDANLSMRGVSTLRVTNHDVASKRARALIVEALDALEVHSPA